MSERLELLNFGGPWIAAFIVLWVGYGAIRRIFATYQTRMTELTGSVEGFPSKRDAKSINDLPRVLLQNMEALEGIYSLNQAQYRAQSLVASAIGSISVVFVIAGIVLKQFGEQAVFGLLCTLGGLIGGAAAIVFALQSRAFQQDMATTLDKIVAAQHLMTAVSIAKQATAEGEELERINAQLMSLIDVLYGSPERGTASDGPPREVEAASSASDDENGSAGS